MTQYQSGNVWNSATKHETGVTPVIAIWLHYVYIYIVKYVYW